MQLSRKFEIQSREKIASFLNSQPVGRIATIDAKGFPQIIPMNFVYLDGMIYMHSHPAGEKIDNLRSNPNAGFEVDQHVCFLPSYYFHPTDASQADTLYVSVVIKGRAELVANSVEKSRALNALMQKYQKEGDYEPLEESMHSVEEVAVIKIIPRDIRGKYKVGQHWSIPYRLKMAQKIIAREGAREAEKILALMGVKVLDGGQLEVVREPLM